MYNYVTKLPKFDMEQSDYFSVKSIVESKTDLKMKESDNENSNLF